MWYDINLSAIYINTNTFEMLQILGEAIADTIDPNCSLLGYTPSLLCSRCDELKQFSLDELTHTCRQCCQQDDSGGVRVCHIVLLYCIIIGVMFTEILNGTFGGVQLKDRSVSATARFVAPYTHIQYSTIFSIH
jgi:hypothetical protein